VAQTSGLRSAQTRRLRHTQMKTALAFSPSSSLRSRNGQTDTVRAKGHVTRRRLAERERDNSPRACSPRTASLVGLLLASNFVEPDMSGDVAVGVFGQGVNGLRTRLAISRNIAFPEHAAPIG